MPGLDAIATVLVLLATAQNAAAQSDSTLRIDDVKGFLYFSGTGGFSENVIDNDTVRFWNTTSGGGSPGRPASQMLIRVRLQGRRPVGEPWVVRVSYVLSGRRAGGSEVPVGVLEGGTEGYSAGFWIDRLGCEPLDIHVELRRGQTVVQRLRKTVPLRCGE
jgi:hypothetical protein